jgi:hypothetical protein
MTTRLTKILTGIAAAATLAVTFSSPAQAWHGHGHGWRGFGGPFVIGAYDTGPSCTLVNVYSKSGRYLRTVTRCY